ncbi:Alpha/Beta hydrolase protein [Echria macrotheca]|uniref:Carboxypeptidase n=1 Tax=Echria macrotheca TaxID=438768 RepID=A0AAJ0FG18_9PEZI|nr:Alpha/Beta hydrolase protein [Echria macrotheca]
MRTATLVLAGLLSLVHVGAGVGAGRRHREALQRQEQIRRRQLDAKTREPPYESSGRRQSRGRFLNENTMQFAVNGSGIPDVDFDVGESYAGSLPISAEPGEESSLFFWFFPTTNQDSGKDILIWLNGGPGCSSLEGLLQENGPFLWQYGTYRPVQNPWSWHTLTNVIWIEQPVGTGFSRGRPTAQNEEDVARQFNGFWRNFVDLFGLHGYKVYISGESYAGMYCSYIASAMLDANDTNYYDVTGLMMYDPSITYDLVQEVLPTAQFVEYWGGLFPFNDTFRQSIRDRDKKCGFSAFIEKHLVFPPKENLPPPRMFPGRLTNGSYAPECADLFGDVLDAAGVLNPCFDVYQIATTCPVLWDVLGFPGSDPYIPHGAKVYFNRTDVKMALHAPLDVAWEVCTDDPPVFVNWTDTSPPPTQHALPRVIDATQNVLIAHGALDMVLMANGTLLALQNMTWGGRLGFQTRPDRPFYVPRSWLSGDSLATSAGAGVFGSFVTERGLTYVGVALAGHMIPQYAPAAAYRQLEYLLGRVDCLNCTVPFTTDGQPPPQSLDPLGAGTAPQGWSDDSLI